MPTETEIEQSALTQARNVGTVPFNNMIRALQMHSWRNTHEEQVRLLGALRARKLARATRI
jgi:hypothetical protein